MNHIPGTTTAGHGGDFDPRQAAALLDQATRQARRQFTPGTPAPFVLRAVLALVIFGGLWLSVRGQDPYAGPSGRTIVAAFALAAINIGWSAWAIKRAGAGVSGPAQRAMRARLGVMLVAWVAAYAVIAPLYHAGASHPVWGLYPATAPLLIVGLAGAWLITGIGLCAVCLGTAAFTARLQRRSVVRP